jgi:hypothetical protein
VHTTRTRAHTQAFTVLAQVAVQKASLDQNTKVAETLRDELNKGKDLADVKMLAQLMKDDLAKQLGSYKEPATRKLKEGQDLA